MNTYHFTLDITPGGVTPVIHAVQYDNLGRTMVITLTDGSGLFVPDDEVTSVSLYARKPDGTRLALSGSWSAASSQVTVDLTAQLTAAAGRAMCLLSLTGEGEEVLGSAPFVLQIAENPCDPGSIVSSDDFRAAVTAWVEEHTDELAELYGERIAALEARTAACVPENLVPWPYVSGESMTAAGLTYTVNTDGTVHVSGTAEGTSDYYFAKYAEPCPLPAGEYTLSGGVSSDLRLIAANTTTETVAVCTGEPVTFTAEAGEQWYVRIRANKTAGTVDTDIAPVISPGDTAQAYTHPKYAANNLLRMIEQA